jgi:hypothetical protein
VNAPRLEVASPAEELQRAEHVEQLETIEQYDGHTAGSLRVGHGRNYREATFPRNGTSSAKKALPG